MIKIISKLTYTIVCDKCQSEISFDHSDTDYIDTGYKDGIYGIYCPVCRNPLDRNDADATRVYDE